MDDDMMAMMGFSGGFGKKAPPKKVSAEAKVEQTRRGTEESSAAPKHLAGPSAPPPPHVAPSSKAKPENNEVEDDDNDVKDGGLQVPSSKDAEDGGDDDDDEDLEDEPEQDFLPISHEIQMKDHTKPISALALDPSGARIASGSHDYDVKIYDFGGMDSSLKPFRSWEPTSGYHVHHVEFSSTGENLLVINGTTQAQMYTRDGESTGTFMKGDPYLRDMKHTKGHVAELTSGAWNPKNAKEFITASNDSTIRIWDVENKRSQKTVVVVKSKERGNRTKITACAFSPDGKTIGGAGLDGTVHIWSTSSNFARPNATKEDAHIKGTETSGMAFSIDGRTLATRGGDDTVKLWDLRSLRAPLFTASNLSNLYPETNIIFSPDDRHILTGLGASRAPGSKGELAVLSKEGLEVERKVTIGEGTIVKVQWHSRINQIVTGSSTGRINVLYSPHASMNGALLPLRKLGRTAPREINSLSALPPVIYTPHALPAFRDDDRNMNKRKREKERMDPVKTKKPMEPVSGPGRGGRVGASATQHLLRGVIKDNSRAEDPREALLKYADQSEQDPQWTKGWKDQPKIFRNIEDETGTREEKK